VTKYGMVVHIFVDKIAFTSPPVLRFTDSRVCLQATVRSELAIYNKDFSTSAC
jgi:hypothetical protein